MKELKKNAVVVFINSEKQSEKQNLSPIVLGALRSSDIGNFIPKALVSSANQSSIYATVGYKEMDDKTFRTINKTVKSSLSGDTTASTQGFTNYWYMQDGRFGFNGSFVSLKDNETVIINSRNKQIERELSQLSEGAQAYVKAMAGVSNDSKEETSKATTSIESWKNTAGKSIRGRFISLEGDKITLQMSNGKKSTFDISLLSQASQDRAKELASQ